MADSRSGQERPTSVRDRAVREIPPRTPSSRIGETTRNNVDIDVESVYSRYRSRERMSGFWRTLRSILRVITTVISKAIVLLHSHWYFVQVLAVVPTCVLLAGCSRSSGSMPSVFVISLDMNKYATHSQESATERGLLGGIANDTLHGLEVRVGYFSNCLRNAQGEWTCGAAVRAPNGTDPLDLVGAASKFRDTTLFPGLIIVVTLLTVTVPFIKKMARNPDFSDQDEMTRSDLARHHRWSHVIVQNPLHFFASYLISILAFLLALVAALCQHFSAVSVSSVVPGASMGVGSIVCVWLIFLFAFATVAGEVVLRMEVSLADTFHQLLVTFKMRHEVSLHRGRPRKRLSPETASDNGSRVSRGRHTLRRRSTVIRGERIVVLSSSEESEGSGYVRAEERTRYERPVRAPASRASI